MSVCMFACGANSEWAEGGEEEEEEASGKKPQQRLKIAQCSQALSEA